MKNDVGGRYRMRILANIAYSGLISCLVMAFVWVNLTMIARYMQETGTSNRFCEAVLNGGTVMLLAGLICGMALFGVVFFILQEPYIRYIGRICESVKSISDGNLNTQVEVLGDDEFSEIALNLNRMAAEIRSLMEKERQAEQTKDELITNVAHDLRTPLTSVIGYLELLSGDRAGDEKQQKKYIGIAYAKARRLEKLIEDLFSFTKLGGAKAAMHVSQLDIVQLMSQLMEEAYPSFARSGLSYELTSNVSQKYIVADGDLLARLFENLIANAVKYGAEGKSVNARIYAQEDTVQISVINYGYVIPENELGLIFDRFYRVERSRSGSTGGTGLGLAIVKEIVRMHAGSVEVASDLNGTVFTVKLPVNFPPGEERFDIS